MALRYNNLSLPSLYLRKPNYCYLQRSICCLHCNSTVSSSPFPEKHSLQRYQRDRWVYNNNQNQNHDHAASCAIPPDTDSIRLNDIALQLPELRRLLQVLKHKRETQTPGTAQLPPGNVFLVGTGPGDPDLLTIKAVRVMQTADLLLYDRLVSNAVLDLVGPEARLLYVGKTAGYHSRTQEEIHELLLSFAEAGATVVRLKGGDPLVFGRGGEEMDFLQQQGIEVKVIPGITAASGIAAELCIPLTHRGVANSVRFLTGHSRKGGADPLFVAENAADPDSTLVVYMGLSTLPSLAAKLIHHGLPPDTPAAAVERGTTPQQRIVFGELKDLADKIKTAELLNPTWHVHKHQVASATSKSSCGEELAYVQFSMQSVNAQEDYNLKETNPEIGERWPNAGAYGGRGWMNGERLTSTYDLVQQMFYLYVRVVKGKDLPPSSVTGSCDPYVEVKLGNYKGRTRHFERKMNPEWNQVFAFSKDRVQSSLLEVFVKDKEMVGVGRDDYLGRVVFDLNEIPTRVPPDSPLAPQWYRLEERRGQGKVRGEVMLAVWMGTQADEAFPDAWHSDAASVHGSEAVSNTRSKVYVSPKLWYLRVNVIEAQDVVPNDRNQLPQVFVKAQLGNQLLRTKICPAAPNPLWNEDLVFVTAEPFEEQLLITVEDRVHPSKEDVLGKMNLPLSACEKRLDHRPVHSRWFNLEKYGFGVLEADRRKELNFSSRIHLRVCLEGGYHVLDESTMYISDQRPTARQLWKQPVGILEVGILGAQGLLPMKMNGRGSGSTDAYCVAKYGHKWVRTRTILDSFNPKWNEQYTWEVYDPCTVITLGVFDNTHLALGSNANAAAAARDSRIGKVRIRLSTLEAHRTYTHSYPLVVLHPHGVKKMGELQLAVRFTSLSLANMMYIYARPLLPKMHYLHPFTVNQVDNLRYQAMNMVALRLGRAEPPLRKEVVEYMLDVDSHMWSMRRSKANFFRIMSLVSGMITVGRWFGDVCNWNNPITSVLVHILFLILVWYPDLILPTLFLYMFLIGIWNYRFRPRYPPHMDTKLSWAEAVNPDELDEEFDTFPTCKQHDIVRMRYDRLRSVAGRIQTVLGDIATQGERFQSLLGWRDPRATTLFLVFCLSAALVLYATPFRVVALLAGLYYLRHPRFRSKLPSLPSNFFKRLPARTDTLL
ncbi:C2 calcium-dependent membrane targeting [Corchorus capsularis]|uniref:uroporphyrinogen-III C-methyltransferase n=1 Tax=Corchorus capsularis TaxID=210143 RepID=A0A1R3HHM3_COCAP|nr:C2 calcium-dependent membrane targeting [Corchorus capsularis]